MGKIVHLFLVFRSETGEFFDLNNSINSWFFFLFFFQCSKIYPSAKITTSKMLRIIEVSPVRWSCAIIFVPQKEVSYFTTLVPRNFLTFTKLQNLVFFFGYIFINCKYYKKKKNNTYWGNWAVTENVCNYIFTFCFHIIMNHNRLSISGLK